MRAFLILITVFGLTAFQAPKASITFKIKNAGFSVKGNISGLQSDIHFDPANLAQSTIKASVRSATLDTDIKKRDEHLHSEDFLDILTYPKLSFISTSILQKDAGYVAKGKLTIKDVTRTIEIPFAWQNNWFKGEFTINRQDYDVGSNSWILSDDVTIQFDIPQNTSH